MDSTEIPVHGEQENSTYNGHFESTCYHPLLLFNREGDYLAAKLRPGSIEWGSKRSAMERVDYAAGDLGMCPRHCTR
jgi:Transposase DDE domain group 1